jgi:ribosomal protein S1
MRKENRDFTRLAMHAKANMLLEGQCINGEVENLSLKGAFIVAGEKLKMNQVVSITIDDPIACDIRAKVVRVTDKGIGLEFEKNLLD